MRSYFNIAYRAILLTLIWFFNLSATPKLTVVMVIDQFAQDYIEKLQGNFNYAFKELLEKGINFTNAHHPHGTPTTATGHTALNTGTFACKHGIVLNGWFDENKKEVKCDGDDSKNSLTFDDHGLQKYGSSAKNIMVQGLTDNFLKKSKKNKSFSISYKSRAAIGMSGKNGCPIWFDKDDGIFTTSKAFLDKIPDWLLKFNKNKIMKKLTKNKKWKLLYPRDGKYYDFEYIDFHKDTNYKYAGYNESLILNDAVYTTTGYIDKSDKIKKRDYDGFLKTPFANKLLLNTAKECIKNNYDKATENLLLWVSLSPLDALGHIYGPQSLEVTDMIYQLDKQIGDFWNYLKTTFGEENILFILTADHGVEPLVEVMQKSDIKAYRINVNDILIEMNEFIQKKYAINDLVMAFKTSQFYFDKDKIEKLDNDKKEAIIKDLKNIILSKKGVRYVWSYDELSNMNCKFDSFENFYKQQLYPSRSGDLICMPKKYSTFTKHIYGTGHRSAYSYNTKVPLIIYQKGQFENKKKDEKVWIPQLPVTIANILEIEKPLASEFLPLSF
ncbi:MAG: alkaline phosphatase family protein [bacterium]